MVVCTATQTLVILKMPQGEQYHVQEIVAATSIQCND
jgi:hypothetical protein